MANRTPERPQGNGIAPLLAIYDGMPGMTRAIDAYESAGFANSGMFPVSREPATGRVIEYDCVMVRPETVGAS